MIKINLLPVEKRKAERTPLPRFMLVLVTAATAAGLVLWVAAVWLQIKGVERDIETQKKRLASLQVRVAEYEKLSKEVAELKRKIQEITDVTSRNVDWWRTMSALWDVIHQHPKVWIDDIRAQDERAAASDAQRILPGMVPNPGPLYAVNLKCHVGGMEVSEMTRFRNALKEHVILQETLPTLNFNVDWTIVDEKDYDEKHSITFSVTLLGPGKRYEPPKPPTPAAKPGTAATGTAPAAAPAKQGTAK